jgi:hypothetical protein
MYDLNEREDYLQYGALLLSRGMSAHEAHTYLLKIKKAIRIKEARICEAAHSKAAEQNPNYKSDLDVLLDPEGDAALIPAYHRWIGILIDRHGLKQTAHILNMPRMSLYRWLKERGYRD